MPTSCWDAIRRSESASIRIESTLWKRLTVDGKPHPSAFMRGSGELQTTSVERCAGRRVSHPLRPRQPCSAQDSKLRLRRLHQGLADHAEGDERPALWHCRQRRVALYLERSGLRRCAQNDSRDDAPHLCQPRQQVRPADALRNGRERARSRCAEIDEIEITMPNKHCLLVDLSRFGQDNPNEIFVPTDEPHGYIEARVRRKL